RNISELQHIKPTYAFVSKSAINRFRNVSPAKFGVGRRTNPRTVTPLYTLFDHASKKTPVVKPASSTRPTSDPSGTTPTATTPTNSTPVNPTPAPTNTANPAGLNLNPGSSSNFISDTLQHFATVGSSAATSS